MNTMLMLLLSSGFAVKCETIVDINDTYSASFILKRNQTEQYQNVRKVLSLDGGGIRGGYTAIELAVLEHIINIPENNKTGEYIYLHDIFDVFAGTSTGSIIAAGLNVNSNTPLKAYEIAQLYTRYGYKIFTEQASNTGNVIYAKYSNEGLINLLKAKLGGETHLQAVYKDIYIAAINETDKELAIFSNTDTDSADNKPFLHEAVLRSASAPTYFPAVTTNIGKQMSDGGTNANNPAFIAYQNDKIDKRALYQIFSFGTGVVPVSAPRRVDSGVTEVATILDTILTASEKQTMTQIKNEIKDGDSKMQECYRINPKLDKAELDRVDDAYINEMIQTAFEVTKGETFKAIVKALGYTMPEDLDAVHNNVMAQLLAISSNDFSKISDPFEKEYIVREIAANNLNLYDKGYYRDADGSIKTMNANQKEAFLTSATAEVEKLYNEKADTGTKFYFWWKGMSIEKFINHGLDAHKLTNYPEMRLNEKQLNSLLKLEPKNISLTEDWNKTIQEMELNFNDKDDGNVILNKIMNRFTAVCQGYDIKDNKNKTSNINYDNDSSPLLRLASLVLWKNTLKNVESNMTPDDVEKIYNLCHDYSYEMDKSKNTSSWFTVQAYTYVKNTVKYNTEKLIGNLGGLGGRYYVFSNSLSEYSEKSAAIQLKSKKS